MMSWRDRDYARPDVFDFGAGGVPRPFRLGQLGIVRVIITINVAVYVLASFSPSLKELFYGQGALVGRYVARGQIWRLLTAQYLHAGTGHLLLNMLGLYFLGRPLEQMWSRRRFFVIYTLSGLAGNLFFSILAIRGWINPLMPAVGASGCIFGLLGIVAVLFPNAMVYVFFLFPIRIRTAAFIFGGLALLSVLDQGENYGGEACHLAGLVFGIWWALRGDQWWSAVTRGAPRRWRVGRVRRPKVRIVQPQVEPPSDDEVDRVLKKVYDGGLHSLSEAEKRVLRDATERQRSR